MPILVSTHQTQEMIKAIRAALEHEPRLKVHRFPISITPSKDAIILAGEVEHIVAKKLTLELATAVLGNRGLIDRLRVVPGQRMEDGTVRDHVCAALLQEPILVSCTIRFYGDQRIETYRESILDPRGVIEVSVTDGVVTLNGQVKNLLHKRLAGVLAWWVPGSRDVINDLEDVSGQDDNDDAITDAVRLALEQDPFVTATDIQVSTTNAVVTLKGVAASPAKREMAEFDAWYVFGVDQVVNHVAVRA